MDYIRKEVYEPDVNYTNKTIDTEFYEQRKTGFLKTYSLLFNALDDKNKELLKDLKLFGNQMLYEASAESFARGFRCAMRLVYDSLSGENDGTPEPF